MTEQSASADYADIIKSLSPEKFEDLFNAASRTSRAAVAKKYGIKKKVGLGGGSTKARRSEHTLKVHEAFVAEGDPQLAEELIRTWLYKRRPMLAAALDYMEVPNNNGLTEGDLTPLEELNAKGVKKLQEHLVAASFSPEDIYVYLRFVGIKHVELPG